MLWEDCIRSIGNLKGMLEIPGKIQNNFRKIKTIFQKKLRNSFKEISMPKIQKKFCTTFNKV